MNLECIEGTRKALLVVRTGSPVVQWLSSLDDSRVRVPRVGATRWLFVFASDADARALTADWRRKFAAFDLVTTQWCTLAVCGPHATDVVARVFPRVDTKGFTHMSVRETEFDAHAVMLMRVSFTGEPSFEISIGASHGVALLASLMQEGRRHRIETFGLEALDVLRLEKGHFEVGVDTDVDTSPIDVGWGSSLAKKKADFIGRRSLTLPVFTDHGRKQLVGLESERVLPIGAATPSSVS